MPALQEYVSGEMSQSLQKLGYDCTVLPNPRAEYGPFLIARRIEDPAKPTVLTYGHGDVIRGQEEQWRQGLSPWKIVIEGDRMYGRGTADNKGQHTINIAALGLRARGARIARLQLDHPDRDRRGDRLAGPGRLLQGQQGGAQGRRADRLGRAAARPSPADHLRRHARHAELQPQAHDARGRPSLGQLGRAAVQSRHHPGACARHHHRPARPDQSAGMAAQDAHQLGARGAGRRAYRCGRGRARPSIPTGARSS